MYLGSNVKEGDEVIYYEDGMTGKVKVLKVITTATPQVYYELIALEDLTGGGYHPVPSGTEFKVMHHLDAMGYAGWSFRSVV